MLKIIKNYSLSPTYSEENQKYNCKFAFALKDGDTVKVQHKPVLCRDFLLDTLMWKDGYEGKMVYRYHFNGKIDKNNSSLYVENLPRIKENFTVFNNFEDLAGMKNSVLYYTDTENAYLIQGDKKWMDTTLLFSLWTFLIRYLLYTDKHLDMTEFTNDEFAKLNRDSFLEMVALPKKHDNVWILKDCGEGSITDYAMHELNGFATYLNRKGLTVYA